MTPQVLIEFWVVATRPLDANGFGWEPAAAGKALKGFLSIFPLLPDEPQLLDRWLTLVTTFGVRGKRAHDIRLVAIMAIHGVSHILTFNTADFANIGGVVALSPPVARESQ